MHNIVVGTGPSAAAAILALADDPAQKITVIDIGERLPDDAMAALGRMRAQPPAEWDHDDRALVTAQPAPMVGSSLPQKRAYGSDYMFVDRGQQRGLAMPKGGNEASVSGAAGGFSTVWGAQIMPFTRATFNRWPFRWNEIEPHYRAVLAEVPLAGEEDDFAQDFPLLNVRSPLPVLSGRAATVLHRYYAHRAAIRARGIIVGKARLAFEADRCVRCGMCMTGCPRTLIYSASHTVDRFVAKGRVRLLSPVLVSGFDQQIGGRPSVRGLDLKTRRAIRISGDRVFIGAGGLGSTRIALNSLNAPPRQVPLQESLQFIIPFVSRHTTGDPRTRPDFTLNQFNILLKFDDEAYTTSQVHCYPYNPAVATALPQWLPAPLNPAVLGRLTPGFGYLPSWCSPAMTVGLLARHEHSLPDVSIRVTSDGYPAMVRDVLRRLCSVAWKLDLFPLVPLVRISGPGKSYHFGSTFPHGTGSDLLGRIPGFRNIHLIDGSVLPSVPSTTFTLTVMANAHRIASESRHV